MTEQYVSGEEHRAAQAQRPKATTKFPWPWVVAMVAVVIATGLGLLWLMKPTPTNSAGTGDPSTQNFGSNGGTSDGPTMCVNGSCQGNQQHVSGAEPIVGTVTAISATSITIQPTTGSARTFAISSSTMEARPNANPGNFSANDVHIGDTVGVVVDSTDATQAHIILPNYSTQAQHL